MNRPVPSPGAVRRNPPDPLAPFVSQLVYLYSIQTNKHLFELTEHRLDCRDCLKRKIVMPRSTVNDYVNDYHEHPPHTPGGTAKTPINGAKSPTIHNY